LFEIDYRSNFRPWVGMTGNADGGIMATSWENVKVGDSKMRLYLSRPEEARPAPAVIVVQGQTGVDDFLKFSDMAASRGFVAAAPDLYHRDPPDCKDE
jgi:carboxymethylenebutenolidase